MEAKAACDEWVKNGAIETYEAQVPLPKAERDERIRIAKETIDKQEKEEERIYALNKKKKRKIRQKDTTSFETKSHPYVNYSTDFEVVIPQYLKDSITESLYDQEIQKIEAIRFPVTRERAIRSCNLEVDTRQWIGIEKTIVRKHFRY